MKTGNRLSETTMSRACVKWANKIPGVRAKKRHSGKFRKGEPDITGAVYGWRFELEAKVGDNKPTDKQWDCIHKWIEAGCVSGPFWTLDEFKWFINQMLFRLNITNSKKGR